MNLKIIDGFDKSFTKLVVLLNEIFLDGNNYILIIMKQRKFFV